MAEHEPARATGLRPVSVPRAVGAFLLAGLVVLTLVAVGLAVSQRREATDEAVRDAKAYTRLQAQEVVGPLLRDEALVPGPAFDELDRAVRERVLSEYVVRVKVWDAAGTILYSDDTALIGRRFALEHEEREAIEQPGQVATHLGELDAPENVDERQFGRLLQVYLGVRTPLGTPLLFETYRPYDVITEEGRQRWLNTLPVLLAGLALLYLVQVPLAYRMASRLRQTQDEREELLLATLAASDRERVALAADLHDGVVQGLAGASFSLTAAAERAHDPADAALMSAAAVDLRRWVRELRSLVVTITPPALHAQGLAASLTDLAATLELRGVRVTVDVTGVDQLDAASEALVYRAAQEAVRNVVRHADASSVVLTVARESPELLVLTVQDDGRGFAPQPGGARGRGSVGLELLAALASAQGGRLTVAARPGEGTRVVLRLPVAPPVPDPRPEPAVTTP